MGTILGDPVAKATYSGHTHITKVNIPVEKFQLRKMQLIERLPLEEPNAIQYPF